MKKVEFDLNGVRYAGMFTATYGERTTGFTGLLIMGMDVYSEMFCEDQIGYFDIPEIDGCNYIPLKLEDATPNWDSLPKQIPDSRSGITKKQIIVLSQAKFESADGVTAVCTEASSCTSCWQVGHDCDHTYYEVGDVGPVSELLESADLEDCFTVEQEERKCK